jgi:hypothetical protein
MTREEVEQLLNPHTFSPFVLTTKEGVALSVTDSREALVGLAMVVIKHQGKLYQIPFHAIAHVSEAGEQLG